MTAPETLARCCRQICSQQRAVKRRPQILS